MKKASPDSITARKMWLAVTAAFLLVAAAWTVFFVLARRAHVESVPLATQGARP